MQAHCQLPCLQHHVHFVIYDPMQPFFWSKQSSIKGGVRSAICKHPVQANQGSFVAVLLLLFGSNHLLRLFPGLSSGVLQYC